MNDQEPSLSIGPNSKGLDWSGMRPFRVSGIRDESASIRSFWLSPNDQEPLPYYLAGQYIPIRTTNVGGGRPLTRTYSLSAAPGDSRSFRVSIKREEGPLNGSLPAGVFSNHMHNSVSVGDTLLVGAPRGDFVLDNAGHNPVCLLSAGVGVTPIMSMFEKLVYEDDRRPLWFVHGTRNGELHAYRDTVHALADDRKWITAHTCYSRPQRSDVRHRNFSSIGRVDISLILSMNLPPETHYFLCGPHGFLRDLFHGLSRRGIDASHIHYEHFGARIDLANENTVVSKPKTPPTIDRHHTSDEPTITFSQSGVVVQWDESANSILELAEAANIAPMYSCRSGICQTCSCRMIAGAVDYFNEPAVDPEEGEVLICSARPRGNIVLDL